MRRTILFVLVLFLGAGFGAVAQKAKEATIVDPDVHHVVMENEHVRVFEALAAHGWKSPMHTHPPFVLVSLGLARLKMTRPDGTSFIFDLHPGQVIWMEGAEHSWELLAGEVHVIGIEVKSAQAAKAQ